MKARLDVALDRRSAGYRRRRAARGRGYSRFVQLSKWLLPATALCLLLLVVVWPHIEGLFDTMRIAMPRLDLRDARDLQMTDARYHGIDKQNRPFVITADVARQTPQTADLVSLDMPKADLTTQTGGWIKLTADSGIYQPNSQLLDLFGDVSLTQDKGDEFHSASARLDMGAGSAEGTEPIEGRGLFGSVKAEGFRIVDRGETIVFTGHAHLVLIPRRKAGP